MHRLIRSLVYVLMVLFQRMNLYYTNFRYWYYNENGQQDVVLLQDALKVMP